MSSHAIELPLSDVGLDSRPTRQVRPLDQANVHHLVTETDPQEWDAIIVRPWPESDPFPEGEQPRYQVISGYHRTSAAHKLGMTTIRAIVRDDVDTDAQFVALATRENQRHGKGMSADEKRAVCVRLSALGMSLGDIAKETGIPKGTVHTWLSRRDTNAGRSLRTQQSSRDIDKADVNLEWQAAPLSLDARRLREVNLTISNFLAALPDGLPVGDVVTWAASLPPAERRSHAADLETIMRWLGNLRIVMTSATPEEGAA